MKNSYTLAGVVVLAIIIVVGAVWYSNQSANFMTQLATSTASLFTQRAATSTPAVATSTNTSPATTPAHPVSSYPSHITPKPTSGGTTVPAAAPHINAFEPASASVGSTVTIVGTGFSRTSNSITFGTSEGRHRADGSPDNQIATGVASPDGITLTFTVPSSGPSGILCDAQGNCIAVSAMRITAGSYPVTVRNANGTSAEAMLTVTGS